MPEKTPIKDSLDEILKTMPSTGRGFSETLVTVHGFRTEVGHRINEKWKVGAFVGGGWKGKPEGGLILKGSW